MTDFIVSTDGGSRGNPGPAGIGIVLTDSNGRVVATARRFIGEATNNVAEYIALIEGLALAKAHGATRLRCRLDSELVVRQLNREYKVKDAALQRLFVQAWNVAGSFHRVTFEHVSREKNESADALVNQALDEAEKKRPSQA